MAHLTIWNVALGPEQIAVLATGVNPNLIAQGNIVLHVPLDNTDTKTQGYQYHTGAQVSFTCGYNAGAGSIGTCATGPNISAPIEPGSGRRLTFSLYRDPEFHDWRAEDDALTGVNFESYFYTYYHLVDDTALWLQSPYIYTYLDNTSRNGNEPSLIMQPVWEWAEDAANTKFSREIQVYDFKQDQTVSNTKNRVRGTGRALQLRFTSENDRDFNILGWGIFFDRNARY